MKTYIGIPNTGPQGEMGFSGSILRIFYSTFLKNLFYHFFTNVHLIPEFCGHMLSLKMENIGMYPLLNQGDEEIHQNNKHGGKGRSLNVLFGEALTI